MRQVAVSAAMKSGLKVISACLKHIHKRSSSECRDEKRTESIVDYLFRLPGLVAVSAAMKSGLKVIHFIVLKTSSTCSSECRDEKRTERTKVGSETAF